MAWGSGVRSPNEIDYQRGAVPVLLGHAADCRRDSYPEGCNGRLYDHVVLARLFDVCFDLWGQGCCYNPERSPAGMARYVEDWCGLRLLEADEVHHLVRDDVARERWRPPGGRWGWEWLYALPAVFQTARKTYYLAADVLRVEALRRALPCYWCKRPFATWDAAARLVLALADAPDDPHRSLAVWYCSAACKAAREERWRVEDADRRAAAERDALRKAQRLLKEAKRLSTDPAYRRAARAAEKRRRADEERRKVVPMTKEI